MRANPHDREIWRLAWPAFVALIAEPLYLLVDTAIVGHLGTPELAGLAIAASLLVTGYTLFIFLAYGTTGSVSRSIGAGDHERAAHLGAQALWLALGLGVLLAATGAIFSGSLVDAMGGEGEVRIHALTYLRISLIGVPALLVTLAGTGYLRGLQDTRTPLVVTVATSVVNVVIQVALIYGLGYGIGASALSTVVAQTGGALFYVFVVLRSVTRTRVSVRPDGRSLRRLLKVSSDLFIRTAALRLVLLMATAVASRLGATALASHQIAFELWNFLAFALDAVAIAGQSLIGRLLGAGLAEQARAAGRRMIEWGLAAGCVLGLAILLTRPILARLFTPDNDVIAVTTFLLLIVAALQPINGIAFVLDGVLIGAGDFRFLAWAMAGAALVFVIGALLVVGTGAGIGTLWAAIGVFMTARAGALLVRFASPRWEVVGEGGASAR